MLLYDQNKCWPPKLSDERCKILHVTNHPRRDYCQWIIIAVSSTLFYDNLIIAIFMPNTWPGSRKYSMRLRGVLPPLRPDYLPRLLSKVYFLLGLKRKTLEKWPEYEYLFRSNLLLHNIINYALWCLHSIQEKLQFPSKTPHIQYLKLHVLLKEAFFNSSCVIFLLNRYTVFCWRQVIYDTMIERLMQYK